MKNSILFIALTLSLSFFACDKSVNNVPNNGNCVQATVIKTPLPCVRWGIALPDGTDYPTDDMPVDFQQEGLKVCVVYQIVGTPAGCTCCETKVVILSITRAN